MLVNVYERVVKYVMDGGVVFEVMVVLFVFKLELYVVCNCDVVCSVMV